MFLHKRRLFFVVVLFVLLIGFAGLPVYAQPEGAGPPEIVRSVIDEPEVWAVLSCNGYKAQVTVNHRDLVTFTWYREDGSRLLRREIIRESVTLENLGSGRSVDVKLDYEFERDYDAVTSTIRGIRSAIVSPDGGVNPVNVGQLILSGLSDMKGEVLSVSGTWDAVTDGVFDHASFACELVAD